MGWKSTITVNRIDAESRIAGALRGATDEQVAEALEALCGEKEGANYMIANTCAECGAPATNTLGSHCEKHQHLVF